MSHYGSESLSADPCTDCMRHRCCRRVTNANEVRDTVAYTPGGHFERNIQSGGILILYYDRDPSDSHQVSEGRCALIWTNRRPTIYRKGSICVPRPFTQRMPRTTQIVNSYEVFMNNKSIHLLEGTCEYMEEVLLEDPEWVSVTSIQSFARPLRSQTTS